MSIYNYIKNILIVFLTFLLGSQTTYAKIKLVLPQNQVSFSIEQSQNFKSLEKELQPNLGFLKEKYRFLVSDGIPVVNGAELKLTKYLVYAANKNTGEIVVKEANNLGADYVAITKKIPVNNVQNGITKLSQNIKNYDRTNVVSKLADAGSDLLNASGKFIDDVLETDYLKYVTRKTNAGKTARPRLEWKKIRDYWLNDSPLARGNAFNKKAVSKKWYPYNEIHLGNGKRLDSYKPPSNGNPGEIVSRKATDLGDIQLSTFESYLNEMLAKYSPGTAINSPKYTPYLDNQFLQGQMFLEIPASNQSLSNIQDYINLANNKGITLRFKIE